MRAPERAPAHHAELYAQLVDDARTAERLGFHSLWLSEHHNWYDGWCPALLVAGAAVLAATTTLHVGTGVLLLPLHDPERIARAGSTLERLAPGRTELGVGLGYREPELDALGLSRRRRGARMDRALDVLAQEWAGGGPQIWIGGIAERSLERAARRGLSLFLPSSMRPAQLARVLDGARQAAAGHGVELGRVGVLKQAWLTDGSAAEERRARSAIAQDIGEYGGAWWRLGGQRGFAAPELLGAQMRRSASTAAVGPAEAIVEELAAIEALGVDLVVLQLADHDSPAAYRENLQQIAADVVPQLA